MQGSQYLVTGISLVLFCSLFGSGCSRQSDAESLNQFVGAPSRAVWVRQVEGNGTDPLCRGDRLSLMGMDGETGAAERRILPEVGSFRKPLITPDGNGVVFTRFSDYDFYFVNWDGSGLRKLGHGHAAEVWKDPATGVDWVYYIAGESEDAVDSGKPVMRCRLDKPEIQEMIWEKTSAGPDNLQLSADGTIMAGLFPWPLGGVVDVPSQTLLKVGTGCWSSVSPDNQYLVWVFDGPHKGIVLRSLDGSIDSKIRLNSAPRCFRHEVYHPRWSNHPDFFTMTGPYKQKGQYNNITGGGKDINIYIGQFDAAYKKVHQWFQLTEHSDADFYPDLWVQGARELCLNSEVGSKSDISALNAWPVDKGGLKFVWTQADKANAVDDPELGYLSCELTRKGKARLGRFFEMDVADGSYFSDEMGEMLSRAIAEKREFTVFFSFVSNSENSADQSVLMALGRDQNDLNLAFVQREEKLELLVSDEVHVLGSIEAGIQQSACLSYSRKTGLRFYRQGSMVRNERDIRLPSLKLWKDSPLSLGAWRNGESDWSGTIEGVAWYDRVLDEEEVGRNFAAWIGAQSLDRFKPADRLVINAELAQISPMPTAEGIAPYRSSLVEYLYNVKEVLEGATEDRQVIVQHWAILDAVVYPVNKEVGKIYRLSLESVDDHPELEGERISSDLIDPVGIYLDVGQE